MGFTRKQSTSNFPKIKHYLTHDTHTYVRVSVGKKCLFFGKFRVLYFLVMPVLRFALLPCYQQFKVLRFLEATYTVQYNSEAEISGRYVFDLNSQKYHGYFFIIRLAVLKPAVGHT